MAGNEFITNKDKIDFKDIVLQHLRRILEHTKNEFRQKKKLIQGGGSQNDIIILDENEGKVYVQMIEQFSFILKPYFDSNIADKYKEHIKIISLNEFEYADKYEDDLKKNYELIYGEAPNKISYKDIRNILIIKQLKEAKLLFIELNMLLKRVDYLKGLVYGEGEAEGEKDDKK